MAEDCKLKEEEMSTIEVVKI